jgi:NlpC/P60 family putative phage cell wall peptidase
VFGARFTAKNRKPRQPIQWIGQSRKARSGCGLWAAALRHRGPKSIEMAVPGDVLLFRMRQGAVAKHLGILSEVGPAARFIHAYSRHGVVESSFGVPWRRRVVACFEFPKEVT